MPIYVGTTKVKPLGISKIFVGDQLVYQKGAPADIDYLCLTNISDSNGWLTLKNPLEADFQYSTDNKQTWTTLIGTSTGFDVAAGASVYFRGNNPDRISLGAANTLNICPITGDFKLSGSIMSLISYTEALTRIPDDYAPYAFYWLFGDSNGQGAHISDASELVLPVNTTNYCYMALFRNSTLSKPPVLPATELADSCYDGMFNGCSNLYVYESPETDHNTPWVIPSTGALESIGTNSTRLMLFNVGHAPTLTPEINVGEQLTYYV